MGLGEGVQIRRGRGDGEGEVRPDERVTLVLNKNCHL